MSLSSMTQCTTEVYNAIKPVLPYYGPVVEVAQFHNIGMINHSIDFISGLIRKISNKCFTLNTNKDILEKLEIMNCFRMDINFAKYRIQNPTLIDQIMFLRILVLVTKEVFHSIFSIPLQEFEKEKIIAWNKWNEIRLNCPVRYYKTKYPREWNNCIIAPREYLFNLYIRHNVKSKL